jgi:hypothetical protein
MFKEHFLETAISLLQVVALSFTFWLKYLTDMYEALACYACIFW